MADEFSGLVRDLEAAWRWRCDQNDAAAEHRAKPLVKAAAAKPKPRKTVMLVRCPARPVDVTSLPIHVAPPHEVRRRILAAESEIMAKAFSDARAGRIDALDLLNTQLRLHELRSMEAVTAGGRRT